MSIILTWTPSITAITSISCSATSKTRAWTWSISTRPSTPTPPITCSSRKDGASLQRDNPSLTKIPWQWDETAVRTYEEEVEKADRWPTPYALLPHPGRQQHDGVPDYDGAAPDGAAPCAQAHRQPVLALRPDRQPLPQGAAGTWFLGQKTFAIQ